ncbi:MAG: aconitase family protein [Evtepia gabavorous]
MGGTINEDDHVFGLSAAIKYGGNFVPANQAVIHQYAREMMSGCGRMILGSDSHTRYGAIGTMGVGEGGPELAKQLLKNTYDIAVPQGGRRSTSPARPAPVWAPRRGAIALCGAV